MLAKTDMPQTHGLRAYQAEAIANLRKSIAAGYRSPILVLPTGAGKTHVAKAMIESAVAKGKSVLFLAPRRELIYQTSAKLDEAEVPHGIIMAGERPSLIHAVQVACIPTLHRRADRIFMPKADLIFVDECHLAISKQTLTILSEYPNAVKIGLTATPSRGDGRGLGQVFDDIVCGPDIGELTRLGHLVRARYFVGSSPDLKGVKLQAGDYHAGQLAERADVPKLTGDIVSNWLRLASDRITIVSAVNIAHALHLREQFWAAGVRMEHIDADTPADERKRIISGMRSGDVRGCTSVDVLTYGVDIPAASCAVIARPTKSTVRHLQFIGRVLRPHPGKLDAMILDHGHTIEDLGFADDPREWTLDGREAKDRKQREAGEKSAFVCKACGCAFSGRRTCPECGHELPLRASKPIETDASDLYEIAKDKRKLNRVDTPEAKRQFYAELKGYAMKHRYAEGWVSHTYRAKYGVWPNAYKGTQPKEPGVETLGWVKHLLPRKLKGGASHGH